MKIKTKDEVKIMAEGGKKLAKIKEELKDAVYEGKTAMDIERLATRLIDQAGGKPSFKMVPKYSWATCVNVNQGVVHGIPKKTIVFQSGDIVSVDVGIYYKGFHTDTSFTVGIDLGEKAQEFLKAGKKALRKAIKKAIPGNRIYDISRAIQETIESAGFSPVKSLVGHGIGRKLHEEPHIPCFVAGSRETTPKIKQGSVFAIEVMYGNGQPEVKLEPDNWTISMADGKISALFEETIAVTKKGPVVLTDPGYDSKS